MGLVFWEAKMLKPMEDKIELTKALCILNLFQLIECYTELKEEISSVRDELSPALRAKYDPEAIEEILSALYKLREEALKVPEEDMRESYMVMLDKTLKLCLQLTDNYNTLTEEKDKDYKIMIDPVSKERRVLQFKSQPSSTSVLKELKTLSKLPSLGQINLPKDLVSSYFTTGVDVLEVGTEADRKKIDSLKKEGKLLFGSLEGLSGGTAFFKAFSIALAKILNEQSKYYHPEEDKGDHKGGHLLSGVPRDRVKEIFGATAKLEGLDKVEKQGSPVIKGEKRDFSFILLSYERLARELSKTGTISGGKDIEFIRRYINGGYLEFEKDPKTGERKPVKSSYIPGVSSKKYPISNGGGGFVFVPYVVNEAEIVDSSRKDPEVGCLLRLSPQYARTLRGYTALRGDTIQLIGGGRQKEITMDILSFLVFSRNTAPVLRKRKTEILSQYENRPTYKDPGTGWRRTSKLEAHFREAIQKAISAKILLPDPDGYKEETNSGGETICVFTFNPDYLKGEELPPDVQTGEE